MTITKEYILHPLLGSLCDAFQSCKLSYIWLPTSRKFHSDSLTLFLVAGSRARVFPPSAFPPSRTVKGY